MIKFNKATTKMLDVTEDAESSSGLKHLFIPPTEQEGISSLTAIRSCTHTLIIYHFD